MDPLRAPCCPSSLVPARPHAGAAWPVRSAGLTPELDLDPRADAIDDAHQAIEREAGEVGVADSRKVRCVGLAIKTTTDMKKMPPERGFSRARCACVIMLKSGRESRLAPGSPNRMIKA